MKKLALHWQIIIGMVLGAIIGYLSVAQSFTGFAIDWIKPFGTVFINALKLIAVPLILITLINGISSLTDMAKLSRIGGRTVGAYLLTTVFAVSLGLIMVNAFQPGNEFPEEKRIELSEKYQDKVAEKQSGASNVRDAGPLQPLVDIVPENITAAMSSNKLMLQVIFFAILFGVALVMVNGPRTAVVRNFFEGMNDIVIKMVGIIMKYAPIGVFALIVGVIADYAGDDDPSAVVELFLVLAKYSLIVLAGLAAMIVVYALIAWFATGTTPKKFFKGIGPAQLLAFSTSSSAATLPVTMRQAEDELGVSKEVSSFVLPMGATVNMDGTSLFQAVSALFIAQAYQVDLTLAGQLGIVLTCTLSSIGAAAVPGAGTVMLVIVLEQAGIPVEGIALIFAVDRILDMCRTTVNVTGDTVISMLIAKSENQLNTK